MKQTDQNLAIDLLEKYDYQALNEKDAAIVKASSTTFFSRKGWGNWLAALGIAVSCITPLFLGGFPYWAISLAVLSGIVFWRETNYDPVRAGLAQETRDDNDKPFRDKKKHVFLKTLSHALKKTSKQSEKLDKIKAAIRSAAAYHKNKAKALPEGKKKERHTALQESEYFIKVIAEQLRTLTGKIIKEEKLREWLKDEHTESELSDKQKTSLELNTHHPKKIQYAKNATGWFATTAAVVGNGMGCFVAGMNFAGFVASCFGITTIPWAATLVIGSLFAIAGITSYQSNTVPAIKKVTKDSLYAILSKSKSEKDAVKKPISYHVLRILCISIAVSASLIMGSAIGFFNYSFGIFLVGLLLNPAALGNTTALLTLAAPTTTAGVILGATSGILVALGTTCLFLRYITTGFLDKLNSWYGFGTESTSTDSPQKSTPIDVFHKTLQVLLMITLVAVAVYSVNFFVLLPLPAHLQTLASFAVITAGTIVYAFQALSVTSNGIKNYGSYLGDKAGQQARELERGFCHVQLSDEQIKSIDESCQDNDSLFRSPTQSTQ